VFRRPRQGCLAKSTIRHGAEGTGKIQESFLKEMTSSITLTRTNKYLLGKDGKVQRRTYYSRGNTKSQKYKISIICRGERQEPIMARTLCQKMTPQVRQRPDCGGI
jgi:hypothetical protein